jgi:hypothetical protein
MGKQARPTAFDYQARRISGVHSAQQGSVERAPESSKNDGAGEFPVIPADLMDVVEHYIHWNSVILGQL